MLHSVSMLILPRVNRIARRATLITFILYANLIYACEKYKQSPGRIFISADFIIFLPLYLCHMNDANNTSERFL